MRCPTCGEDRGHKDTEDFLRECLKDRDAHIKFLNTDRKYDQLLSFLSGVMFTSTLFGLLLWWIGS